MENIIALDIIIREFCSDIDIRFKHPIIDGDKVVATDGHSMIIAPKEMYSDECADNPKFPKYKDVIPPHEKGKWFCIIPTDKISAICVGIKDVPEYGDCMECDGSGEIECAACGHSEKCEECNGKGESTTIVGYGPPLGKHSAQIGDTFFDLFLLKKLCKVAEQMNEPLKLAVLNKNRGCLFYAGDVLMLLMPLYDKYNNNHII